jgi:hypothetical protein
MSSSSSSPPHEIIPDRDSSPPDEIDSLPESQPDSDELTTTATSSFSDDYDDDDDDSDAERQWKESIEQLELLLSMVLVPYAGKYFGRKFAFWGMLVLF